MTLDLRRYYELNGGSTRHRAEVCIVWVCRVICVVVAVLAVLLVAGVVAP